MSDLTTLTIAEARDALARGETSSVELTDACLTVIEGAGALNAFVHRTSDMARDMAEAADRRIRAGEATAMTGIPVGVKDLFCVRGVPSQSASRILEGFRPEYESTVTQNLWDAGAVMLGKLNMDEFGMGSSTEHSVYGATVNPWRAADGAKRTAGGSSGGSAAAVAAGLCLGSTATDTGGSIRQPAAFTGTVGLRPTYGRVSRWGVIAYASSLDQAGPITRSVRDAAIMLGAMASVDDKDSTSADLPVPDYESLLTGDIRGKRIGIPREYRMDGIPEDIASLWDRGADMLRDAGAEIVDISLPHTKYALPAYYVIAPAEASSNLARYDGVRYGRRAAPGQGGGIVEMYEKTRAEGFGPEVQRAPVFPDEPDRAVVYGVSYPTREVRYNLIPRFGTAGAERVSIGLVHANVGTDTGHDTYAPCTLGDLEATGFDYWALGHVHTRQVLRQANPTVVYPGNPQGRHPNERGARGVYLVDVDDSGAVRTEFRPVDVVRWESMELRIEDVDHWQELQDRLDQEIGDARETADGRDLIARLTLSGRGPVHGDLARPGFLADLRSHLNQACTSRRTFVYIERVTDSTFPAVNRDQRRQAEDFVGDLLRLVDGYADDPALLNDLRTAAGTDVAGYKQQLDATHLYTDPAEAAEGTLRKLYAGSKGQNTVHGSDSPTSASREVSYFFSQAFELV